MEANDPELDAAKRSLHAAEAALRQLDSTNAPGSAPASADSLRAATRGALSALADVGRALSSGDGPEALRIGCPFCGRMVMPAATLCGFCWRKLDPKPRA